MESRKTSPRRSASRPRLKRLVQRVVSGGQTGVDRAALDVALTLGIDCGGWCPKGRIAEDGSIPDRYPLEETTRSEYGQRTEFNVRDSDGTLILTVGKLSGGTALTRRLAERAGKPVCVLKLDESPDPAAVVNWLKVHTIGVLNVAGPRESQRPGVGARAARFLEKVLTDFGQPE